MVKTLDEIFRGENKAKLPFYIRDERNGHEYKVFYVDRYAGAKWFLARRIAPALASVVNLMQFGSDRTEFYLVEK